MARKPKSKDAPPPPMGDNVKSATADEDAAALTTYYQLKIIEAQRKVDTIQVDLKSARDVVNGHFKRMTADLHFTRKDFEAEVIDKLSMSEAEYLASERKRDRLHRLAGLKPGEQIDWIDHTLKDTVDDEIEAESNGYRAGRRGDDPTAKGIAPILLPAFMRGWHNGQSENGQRMIRAHEILEARKVKSVELQPDQEDDDDGHEVDPETQIEEDVQRLTDAGWTEQAPVEADLEEAAA